MEMSLDNTWRIKSGPIQIQRIKNGLFFIGTKIEIYKF